MKTMMRATLALGLIAGVAVAQNPTTTAQPKAAAPKAQAGAAQAAEPGMPGQMNPAMQRRMGMMGGQPNRAQLEQQIRNRIGNQLKNGLKLTDDQFAKLQATNKRFEEKRRLLVEQERDARMAMRDLVIAGDTANGAKISAGIDKMLQIQKQRFELVEQEQKELAGYLSPMQRARFLAMQEQMRRRMDSMRAQGPGRGPNGPPMAGRGGMGKGMGQGMGPGMGQGMGPGMMPPGGMPGMNQKRPMMKGQMPPEGEFDLPPV